MKGCAAGSRRLTVSVSRLGRGAVVETIPIATVVVDLASLRPGFLADALGIAVGAVSDRELGRVEWTPVMLREHLAALTRIGNDRA